MKNCIDPQKPTEIVKERREGGKDEEELPLPTISYGDLGQNIRLNIRLVIEERNAPVVRHRPSFWTESTTRRVRGEAVQYNYYYYLAEYLAAGSTPRVKDQT